MDPSSLAIISNHFQVPRILNIQPLLFVFTNQIISYKLFDCPIHTNVTSAKQQARNTAKTAIDLETQNWQPTLKPGDTIKTIDKEKTWNKKGSVIAPNDHPCWYNDVHEKGNF